MRLLTQKANEFAWLRQQQQQQFCYSRFWKRSSSSSNLLKFSFLYVGKNALIDAEKFKVSKTLLDMLDGLPFTVSH
ncbi:hypothetical protein L6452_30575 [Arctium lappa]|uniref:Uncharacterized protein n=1 Tax=Arctium lappa TaxID=4217 RepID=A0ACB8ZJL4_ARCLA|nr:hypothetical protein L6452_30575 [Arctium lappa]